MDASNKRLRLDESCVDAVGSDELRSDVAQIYASYSRLSSLSLYEPTDNFDEFRRLIELVSRHHANAPINRLAMRLLPRLLHKSPSHSEPVTQMLIDTLSRGVMGDEMLASATRNDAMQGLATIVGVAINHLPPSDAGRLASHISRFIISLLIQPPSTGSSKRSLESTFPPPTHSPESILASCFAVFPRSVLSLCLSSFLDPPSSVMGQGALMALNRVILTKPPAHQKILPASESCLESASLAALVLDRLPETRAWLRQQIVDICKGE
jgi:hypothetical protein